MGFTVTIPADADQDQATVTWDAGVITGDAWAVRALEDHLWFLETTGGLTIPGGPSWTTGLRRVPEAVAWAIGQVFDDSEITAGEDPLADWKQATEDAPEGAVF